MKKVIGTVTAFFGLLSLIFISMLVYYEYSIPDSFYISNNSEFTIKSSRLLSCETSADSEIKVGKTMTASRQSQIKLLGIFPLKKVELNSTPEVSLTPGGSPFGIKLLSEGVMIVGMGEVTTPFGLQSPAKEAGLEIGDVILSINGETDLENNSVSEIIENSDGKSLVFEISRNDTVINLELTPVFCTDTNCYKSGLWVRDSSAGIGTVTYYDNDTGAFAGLGHAVCDIDTGNIIPILSGEVGPVNISGAIRGNSGAPGELIGNFTSYETIGNILYNTDCGVFGTLNSSPTNFEEIPVAYKQEIRVGPATIYSTVEGQTPKEYEILIEKIDLDSNSATKNMVIKITDKDLLDKTGGIVQGMSGSPIIQDGKLIGAVTHVFVNDPTEGYGIFVENMLQTVNKG